MTRCAKAAARAARGSRRTRNALVTAEVALALVLLTGAGLLMQTLWGMQHVDRGFSADRIGDGHRQPAERPVPHPEEVRAFYARLLDRVRGDAGRRSAALTTGVLMPLLANSGTFSLRGQAAAAAGSASRVPVRFVSPGFFETIGARMALGRTFTTQVTTARRRWPSSTETLREVGLAGQDPIGRRLRPGDGDGDGRPGSPSSGS